MPTYPSEHLFAPQTKQSWFVCLQFGLRACNMQWLFRLQSNSLILLIWFFRSTYRADAPVIIPQFLGNSQSYAQAHAQGLQAYHQQPNLAAVHAPVLRSTGQRGSGIIGSAPSSDQLGTYPFPSGSSGRNLLDTENSAASLLYAWERERLAPYSLAPAGSDLTQWGPIHHIYGGSDSSSSLMEVWHWL